MIFDTIDAAIRQAVCQLNTWLPGAIVSYDHTTQKASVQPLLNRRLITSTGSEPEPLPIIPEVPVLWPRSGGASITAPVLPGDVCMLFFCQRSLDLWKSQGGQVTPDDGRKHALSDAVAVMGLQPFSGGDYPDNNTDTVIKYDGSEIRMKPGGVVDVLSASAVNIQTGDVTINCTSATITASSVLLTAGNTTMTTETLHTGSVSIVGNLTVSGMTTTGGFASLGTSGGGKAQITGGLDATGDINAGTVSLQGHVHPYTWTGESGSGNTGSAV